MEIKFDNVSLNTTPYSVKQIKHEESSPRDVFMYNLARERGGVLVDTNYKPKEIVISGIIKGSSQSDLENNIDTFKELLSHESKNLDIDYSNGTRRYKATNEKILIDRSFFNQTYAPFEVTFIVPSGVGEDITQTTDIQNSITTTPKTGTLAVSGTAFPTPQIKITINTITAGTAISLTVNGDKITLTNALVASDIVIFDTENKKVTLNGVEKDYTGMFPKFVVGSNSYQIDLTSSARNYNLEFDYYKKYL